MKQLNLEEAIQYRRSVRVFDKEKEIDSSLVKKCLEQASLAPNSSNLQLWQFHHITDSKLLKALASACFSQPAAVHAKQLVVFVTRKDMWRNRAQANIDNIETNGKINNIPAKKLKMAKGYYSKLIPALYKEFLGILGCMKKITVFFKGLSKPTYREVTASDLRIVAHKSTALAAQTFMLSMAAYQYDTCPMEGFDSKRVKSILKLPKTAEINMIVSCGIRAPQGVYGERFRVPFEEVYFEN